ncbi:hypothetical protein FACS1894170_05390 [Planctomycetales bacterium]|nr:hypothetical protein FACS1894170_05390 [Planctomycetales bacterium]
MFESIPGILYICYGYAIPLVVFAAMYGIRWKEGFWGNTISIGCVWFSILIAVGWWEDAADLLIVQLPQWMFYADCFCLWIIFLLSLILLDTAARKMSRVKVKFAEQVEQAGNVLTIFILAVSIYGFYLFAEDMSPVGEIIASPQAVEEVDATADTVLVKTMRMLSAGSLSSFINPSQFDTYQNFRQSQRMRRQVIMKCALAKTGPPNLTPPRRK